MKSLVLKIVSITGLLFVAACGTSNNNLAGAAFSYPCVGVGCTISATGVSTAPTFSTGDTESWSPVSLAVLSEYVGYQLQSPTNYIINIALTETTASSPPNYSGTMTIQFLDTSTVHNGTFTNGTGTETYQGYNQSVNGEIGTTGVYRIYFEDPLGALILTLSPTSGTDTSSPYTGKVYFRNFNSTAPNPLLGGCDQYGDCSPGGIYCWMISEGPYDCINNAVPPTSGSEPYILLGTIPTVNLQNAMGI